MTRYLDKNVLVDISIRLSITVSRSTTGLRDEHLIRKTKLESFHSYPVQAITNKQTN